MNRESITLEQRMREFEDFVGEFVESELTQELKTMGFFTAPASTKYHGNYPGGLFDHSLQVSKELVNISQKMGLVWQRQRSPYIVGMFHDLCKVDAYKFEDVCSDAEYSEFSSVRYKHNDDVLLKGHGDKSIMLLSQFMSLTTEEILCIRYHMGAYETDSWAQYGMAIKSCPNVLWTHTADMIASKICNV